MNASRRKTSAALVVTLCAAASQAHACGEVMLRALGTMRYHAFVTRNPAAILLYSDDPTGNAKRPAATDPRLHDNLEKVGHKVSMARGTGELAHALAEHRYDVIVAYADDMLGATDQFTKATPEPKLIPVLDKESNEREMREHFPRLVTGNFKDLLKAIEQAMSA
ncbi:hypothetical protein [Variovorax sp. YR216]|uniref:hypothetical protein n=1 Tax=Variovorax sp. YR216 TaxID=1882828 RepID=UPI00089B6AD6|nr:hypothetical protein [Variovorax sp. YR216]SEB08559.1 hypothetical protein SAMN05444680_10790 [Variovorax sp. YR216]